MENAMTEKLKAIEKNNSREITKIPSNKRAIDMKWVFELNLKPNEDIT